MPIRAVVFDLFDTLVDLDFESLPRKEIGGKPLPPSVPALHEATRKRLAISLDAFAGALAEVDFAFRDSHYALDREVPTEQRFEALARRLGLADPDFPGLLTSVHMGLFREQVSVPGHHAPLLAELASLRAIGLCSNFSHSQTAVSILEESGLAPHLAAVVISDAVGLRKPRPEIFEAVLARLGVAPGEALHVGDSLRADVVGAAGLGMRTAWLTRRVKDPRAALEAHTGPAPDFTIRDLSELPALLGT
ncbi:MAG TPA: HAD family hydrolase [Myxococcota bacterium]